MEQDKATKTPWGNMQVSILTKTEVKAADAFCRLLGQFGDLRRNQRLRVYHRLVMLHLLLLEDVERFESNVIRTTSPDVALSSQGRACQIQDS